MWKKYTCITEPRTSAALLLMLDTVLSLTANDVMRGFQSNVVNDLQRLTLEIRNEETAARNAHRQVANQLNLSTQTNANSRQIADPLRDNVTALEKDIDDFNANNVDVTTPALQQQKVDLQKAQTILQNQINSLPNTDIQAVTDEKDGHLKREKELQDELKKLQEANKSISMFSANDEEFLTILRMEPLSTYTRYVTEHDRNTIRAKAELEKLFTDVHGLKKAYEEKVGEKDSLMKEKASIEEKAREHDAFLKGLQDFGDDFLRSLEERLNSAREELKTLEKNIEELLEVSPLEHPSLTLTELQLRVEKMSEEKGKVQSDLLEIERKLEELVEYGQDASADFLPTKEYKVGDASLSEKQILTIAKANKGFLHDLFEHSKLNKIIGDLITDMSRQEMAYLSIFSLGTFAYIIYTCVTIFI